MTVLLLGFGNPDRQDDGVAWHVLTMVARRLGRPAPASFEDGFELTGAAVDFQFVLQLTPELAETVAGFDRVCFVDAHTGSVPQDVNVERLAGNYQISPFTHHMTPGTCLALAQAIYGRRPEAIVVSVRGYHFAFEHSLSPRTAALAEQAAETIYTWLNNSSAEKGAPPQ